MQCGPVRHRVDAKSQAVARPFTHHVLVRPTNFRVPVSLNQMAETTQNTWGMQVIQHSNYLSYILTTLFVSSC
jgi:hypothetical protein